MKLIIGLGNPGAKYERTRHNAGFRAVRAFASAHGLSGTDWKEKFDAQITELRMGTEKIVLMLPQTFMNVSGNAVIEATQFWKVAAEDVMVVYDELDIPLGTIRIRADGSAGGHNGMKSIIERLGTKAIPRIRLGIGTERSKEMASEDFVLGKFSKAEEELLGDAIAATAGALDEWLTRGLASAQNTYGK